MNEPIAKSACLMTVAVAVLLLAGAAGAEEQQGSSASLEERVQVLERKVQELETQIAGKRASAAAVEAATHDSPIEMTLIGKEFEEADLLVGQASDRVMLTLNVRSDLELPVRAFTGLLLLRDLFDREILSVRMTDEDGLLPRQNAQWKGWIGYQEFNESHRRLRHIDGKDLKLEFLVEKIMYADGTRAAFAAAQRPEGVVMTLNKVRSNGGTPLQDETEPTD